VRSGTVRDLLQAKQSGSVKYVSADDSIVTAAQQMANNRVTSLAVKDASTRRVVGILTQGDIIRCLAQKLTVEHMTLKTTAELASWDGEPSDVGLGGVSWDVQVGAVMTPTKKIVYLTPEDSIEEAHELLAVSGKRHIPVLSGSALVGVISSQTVLRSLHESAQPSDEGRSAKDSFVSTIIHRQGVHGAQLQPAADLVQRLSLRSAVCNLPHPHKGTAGEDAYILGPQLVGVADGVGSWWEAGVDPALYARALMHATRLAVKQRLKAGRELRPRKILDAAWQRLRRGAVVGSATVCLVALHPTKPELIGAAVGDSGFLLLRPSSTRAATSPAGTTSGGRPPRAHPPYHVAFRSPQQLRGFNAPFQLGQAPDSPASDRAPDPRFETPQDASLIRVTVEEGDLLVLATDGLFDNLHEQAVLEVVDACVAESVCGSGKGSSSSEGGVQAGALDVEVLATRLAEHARSASLDPSVDSPFALLAKEHDIMWGGGRPDDITIIAGMISERRPQPQTPAVEVVGAMAAGATEAGTMTAGQESGQLSQRCLEAEGSQEVTCGPGEPPALPADLEHCSAEAAVWDWDWTVVEAAATDWD